MKRTLEVEGNTQTRHRPAQATAPGSEASRQGPTLSSLPLDVKRSVMLHLLGPDPADQARNPSSVNFLRMAAVSKDWRRVGRDYIHEPDSVGLLKHLAREAWNRSIKDQWTPVQWRDRVLQSFGYLMLRRDIACLRQHPTPPARITADTVELSQLYNLGLPLDWGGRLEGRLLVNTGAEMTVFIEWLKGRECSLNLELDCSSTAHPLFTYDLNCWKAALATPQRWRGEITMRAAQWAIPLAQAVQQCDWKLSWQDGGFQLSHGDEESAAVHDMAWTRNASEFIGTRFKGDASRPARRTRCIGFVETPDFVTTPVNLSLNYVRWNQHEDPRGVSPAMLSHAGLTDLSLVFKRADMDANYSDSDSEAPAQVDPPPPAPEYLKAIARAGTLQRLLMQVGDDWGDDSQDASGGLLNLVFRGNPGLQAVCLAQMSNPMMTAPEFYEELAGLQQLRELSFIDPDCLPPVECMHALLNALPGLAQLRILSAAEPEQYDKWVQALAPALAAHPGLQLIELNSDAIFALEPAVRLSEIRRWKDLELYSGDRSVLIQARSATHT